MKNLKKLLVLALALTLAVAALAGCGGKENNVESNVNQSNANPSEEEGKTVYNIGLVQLVQHDALDAATNGFRDALTEKLGADGVNFNFQNAAGCQRHRRHSHRRHLHHQL